MQGLIRNDVVKEYRANRILAECNVQQAQILNRYVDPQAQVNYAKDIAELALLWSRKDLTDKEAQLKINEMAYTAWKTALAKQEYKFNEDTAELRKAGMVQDNLGKYYDREQKQLNVALFKRTFGSMFKSAISSNQLIHLRNLNEIGTELNIFENSGSWLFRNLGGLGTYISRNSPIKGVISIK